MPALTFFGIFTNDGLDAIVHSEPAAKKHSRELVKMGCDDVKTVVCTGDEAESFLDALQEIVRDMKPLSKARIAKTLISFPSVSLGTKAPETVAVEEIEVSAVETRSPVEGGSMIKVEAEFEMHTAAIRADNLNRRQLALRATYAQQNAAR